MVVKKVETFTFKLNMRENRIFSYMVVAPTVVTMLLNVVSFNPLLPKVPQKVRLAKILILI